MLPTPGTRMVFGGLHPRYRLGRRLRDPGELVSGEIFRGDGSGPRRGGDAVYLDIFKNRGEAPLAAATVSVGPLP